MASSQVEFAAASSPFGCVLRDHNRGDGCNRDFRKNIKDLVRDHLHTCLPDDNSCHKPIVTHNDNDNRTNRTKLRPLHGSNGIDRDRDGQELSPSSSPLTPWQARGFDRWTPQQAGDMVSSTTEIPSPSPSPSSSSWVPNSQSQSENGNNNSGVGGGASSLVQMWEARLNRSTSINRNNNINITINIPHNNVNHISCSGGGSSSSNSSSSVSGGCSRSPKSNASANVEDSSSACDPELCDRMVASEDPSPPPSSSSSIADSAGIGGGGGGEGGGGQKQKVRVADIIRRLTTSDNDHDMNGSSGSPSVSDHTEAQRGLVPVGSSPRIRGRQAFSDLLMQMERDRHRELDSLSERRAVSQFSHKGRIQSMLKLRLLQRGMADRDQRRLGASGGNSSPHNNSSAIMHLRERFSMATEHDQGDQNHPVEPRSSPRHPPLKNSCTTTAQHRNSHHQEDNASTIEHSCTPTISSSARPIEDLRDGGNPTSNAIYQDGASLGSSNSNLELERPAEASRALHEQESHASTVTCEDTRRVESSNGNLELERPTEASRALHEQASQASTVVCKDNRRVESSNSNIGIQQTTAVCSPPHEVASPILDVMPQGTSSDTRNGNNLELEEPTDALSSLHEEATPPPNAVSQGRSFEGCNRNNVQPQAATDALASLSARYEDEIMEEQDTDNANEEEEWYREHGGRYDWFSDICRPRSYWEDRRQEWYREMLGANSVNEEIRQLIERGRVSSFLSSDFRERMDDLMTSHIQRQIQPLGHQEEEQDDLSSQERAEQLMSSLLQGHEHPIGNRRGEEEHEELGQQEEEEEGDAPDEDEQGYIIEDEDDNGNGHEDEETEDDNEEMEDDEEVEGHEEEEEEGGSLIGHQYHEASDYFDQTTSSFYMPSQSLRSWSFNDNEMNDDHEQVASTSSDQPPPSHSYYQDPQQHSTCMDNLSMEMELVIDLRGQMRQLQREMSELRKSIKSCMEMQVTLQDSMKQEMSSVRGDAARSADKIPRKGNCCICYEKQVDSLLYRCGHMCTCLKCAHELQWSSGKCPICRAPIVDVVRAYTGS